MKKVTDIIINGNGIREIYTAVYYAKMGKSVILATDGEYLFEEGSECLTTFYHEASPERDMLCALEIPVYDVENSLGHIPQGEASISALKALKKHGVEILFDTVKIGTLKKADRIFGAVFANKFGIFCIEAKNAIEFPEKCENYFAFQLSNLSIEGIKTPYHLDDIENIQNITLNRDSKDKNTAVISFESDHKNISQAFERMIQLINHLKDTNVIFENCVLQKTAYSTVNPKFDNTAVVELSDDFQKPDKMEISSRVYPLKDYLTNDILDDNLPFEAYMIKPEISMAQCVNTSVFVAGAGTGGVSAYISLKTNGTDDVIVAERAHLPGGTRTLGMVYAFWNGYQEGFVKNNKSAIDHYLKTTLPGISCRDYTGELLYYVSQLKDDCLYTSYICGVDRNNHVINGVFVAQNNKLMYIKAKFYMDATGDGDMAVFAGCEYRSSGDIRDGFTQSFSIWGETENGILWSQSKYHGDEENISTEKYSEYVRGILASDLVNSPDGFSPILTVRETRSIKGEYTLTMRDIISGKIFDDTVSVSRMYFDAHGNGTSRAYYTDMFLRCRTASKKEPMYIRIPYRTLIPEGLSNMLVISKSISATRDAACFVRMNPDIQNTAYSAGKIVSYMIQNNISNTAYGYNKTTKKLLEDEMILPEWTFESQTEGTIDKISEGDLLSVSAATCDKKNIPFLSQKFDKEKDDYIKYLYAIALAGLKSEKSATYLMEKLNNLISTKDSLDNNSPEIMSTLVLLSYVATENYSCKTKLIPCIRYIVENITSGGQKDTSEMSIYSASKMHATTIKHYKFLIALCYVCEENADVSFAAPIENLIKKEDIAIDNHSNVFAKHLYIRLLAAGARCGSDICKNELKNFLNDEHYFFRTFAKSEIDEITTTPCPTNINWELWI